MVKHLVDGRKRHYIPPHSDYVIVFSRIEGENRVDECRRHYIPPHSDSVIVLSRKEGENE